MTVEVLFSIDSAEEILPEGDADMEYWLDCLNVGDWASGICVGGVGIAGLNVVILISAPGFGDDSAIVTGERDGLKVVLDSESVEGCIDVQTVSFVV